MFLIVFKISTIEINKFVKFSKIYHFLFLKLTNTPLDISFIMKIIIPTIPPSNVCIECHEKSQ